MAAPWSLVLERRQTCSNKRTSELGEDAAFFRCWLKEVGVLILRVFTLLGKETACHPQSLHCYVDQ